MPVYKLTTDQGTFNIALDREATPEEVKAAFKSQWASGSEPISRPTGDTFTDFVKTTMADIADTAVKGFSLGIVQGKDLPVAGKAIERFRTPEEEQSKFERAGRMGTEMAIGFIPGAGFGIPRIGAKLVTPLTRFSSQVVKGLVREGAAGTIIGVAQAGSSALRGEETPTGAALKIAGGGVLGALAGGITGKITQKATQRAEATAAQAARKAAEQKDWAAKVDQARKAVEESTSIQNRAEAEAEYASLLSKHKSEKIATQQAAAEVKPPITEEARRAESAILEAQQPAQESRLLREAGLPVPPYVKKDLAAAQAKLNRPITTITGGLPEHSAGTGTLYSYAPMGAAAGLEEDENGDLSYNPSAAAAGIVAAMVARKATGPKKRIPIGERELSTLENLAPGKEIKGISTPAEIDAALTKAGVPKAKPGEQGGILPFQPITLEGTLAQARTIANSKVVQEIGTYLVPNFQKAPEWIASSRQRVGEIQLGQIGAKRILKAMKQIDENPTEFAAAASEFSGKGTGLNTPGAELGRKLRGQVDELSKAVAAEGLIPQEVVQANLGKYGRRTYLRDILGTDWKPPEEVVSEARRYLQGNLSIQGRRATAAEVETAIYDILNKHRNDFTVGMGKPVRIDLSATKARQDIPEPLRKLMGEVSDVTYVAGRTYSDLSAMLANARFFKKIATGKEADGTAWFADQAAEGYRRLPDTPALGDVRNKFVLNKYHEDLNEMAQTPEGLTKLFLNLLSAWKYGKVVMNPATHGRNILGSVVFADFAQINPFNPTNAKYYKEAAGAIYKSVFKGEASSLYDQALKNGLDLGGYARAELYGAAEKAAARTMLEEIGRGKEAWMAISDLAKKPFRFLGDLYNAEDQVFRLAAYTKQIAKGASGEEAVRHANRWFPNYGEVGKAVKILRSAPGGAPFISFSMEALRIYGNAAKEHPFKLFGWMAGIPAALTAYSLGANGMTIDDWNNFRANLPERLRSNYLVMLPWRDAKGDTRVWDISYILPIAEMFRAEGTPGVMQTTFGLPINPSNFILSDPVITTAAQLLMNRSKLGDRQIIGALDNPLLKSMEFVYQQLMPGLAPPIPGTGMRGGYGYEGIRRAAEGKKSFMGMRRTVGEEALGRLTPFGTIPMGAPELKLRSLQERSEAQQEMNRALNALMMDEDLTPKEKEALIRKRTEKAKDIKGKPGWSPADIPLSLYRRLQK